MDLAHQEPGLSDESVAFWRRASELISWNRAPSQMVSEASAGWQWFPDGRLNTCFNAIDRHVIAGHGDRTALIWESTMTGSQEQFSYVDLQDAVEACAATLSDLGVAQGDRVVIYLPMIPEAVIGMLACARIGAIHSVVFGGFAAPELAARIDDAQPLVILTASCGLEPGRVINYKELVDEALAQSHHVVSAVVVKQRPELPAVLVPGRDLDWDTETTSRASARVACADLAAADPLYILYTSGTTGRPKGVVRDNGGHAVALAWSMRHVFDIDAGDVWWAASDIGWAVGHSYAVYAPLMTGASTVLYEGKPVGTPDAGAFWRICARHGVKGLFTAPTALRAIRRADEHGEWVGDQDLSALEALYVAGERLDGETAAWARNVLGVSPIDNWWQTETGWPITVGQAQAELATGGRPTPGFNVVVLNANGCEVPNGIEGSICLRLPLPPGVATAIWNDPDRFATEYLTAYPGYYHTGDSGYIDSNGAVQVLGRTDDVINVAGHRLSTGVLEGLVASHRNVAECAVVGLDDTLKGQVPHAFVVLKHGVDHRGSDIPDEIVQLVRAQFGAVAALRDVHVVEALPKTRSGKVLRRSIRDLAQGRDVKVPPTIEDPSVLDSLKAQLASVVIR
ncbi:AMP-binding protein (plasmid) [Mycolicibacterium psychrotolerans]|uniref:AMP-binding protein n=1 Tax=Mycolicibacterium psychrotolerans TaxID=216929 RepID=UPI003D66C032